MSVMCLLLLVMLTTVTSFVSFPKEHIRTQRRWSSSTTTSVQPNIKTLPWQPEGYNSWAWEGNNNHRQQNSPVMRKQPQKNKLNWALWRKFLIKIGINPVSKKWPEQLGRPLIGQDKFWKFWFSRKEDCVAFEAINSVR